MKVGAYELESQVGRGGFGAVFRARGADGATVAVKVLHRTTASAVARFSREQRLQGSLGAADGFVPLLDAGESPQGSFLVMPFLARGTLRERFRLGPLSPGETHSLGKKLARALGHAHAVGIVHRDLKPENVLFSDEGEPLVADLGLAKHYRLDAPGASRSVALSQTGELRGSVGYMAPEQMLDSKGSGPPVDVFAIGAILSECLAGEGAFRGETPIEIIEQVTAGTFAPLARVRPDAPPELRDPLILGRTALRRPGA